MAEHLFCKQGVLGSSPKEGSILFFSLLRWRSGQSHQTVNLAPGRATGVQIPPSAQAKEVMPEDKETDQTLQDNFDFNPGHSSALFNRFPEVFGKYIQPQAEEKPETITISLEDLLKEATENEQIIPPLVHVMGEELGNIPLNHYQFYIANKRAYEIMQIPEPVRRKEAKKAYNQYYLSEEFESKSQEQCLLDAREHLVLFTRALPDIKRKLVIADTFITNMKPTIDRLVHYQDEQGISRDINRRPQEKMREGIKVMESNLHRLRQVVGGEDTFTKDLFDLG